MLLFILGCTADNECPDVCDTTVTPSMCVGMSILWKLTIKPQGFIMLKYVYFTIFLECVSDADCNEANKNTCSGKMCICNSGFVSNGASCVGMIKFFWKSQILLDVVSRSH